MNKSTLSVAAMAVVAGVPTQVNAKVNAEEAATAKTAIAQYNTEIKAEATTSLKLVNDQFNAKADALAKKLTDAVKVNIVDNKNDQAADLTFLKAQFTNLLAEAVTAEETYNKLSQEVAAAINVVNECGKDCVCKNDREKYNFALAAIQDKLKKNITAEKDCDWKNLTDKYNGEDADLKGKTTEEIKNLSLAAQEPWHNWKELNPQLEAIDLGDLTEDELPEEYTKAKGEVDGYVEKGDVTPEYYAQVEADIAAASTAVDKAKEIKAASAEFNAAINGLPSVADLKAAIEAEGKGEGDLIANTAKVKASDDYTELSTKIAAMEQTLNDWKETIKGWAADGTIAEHTEFLNPTVVEGETVPSEISVLEEGINALYAAAYEAHNQKAALDEVNDAVAEAKKVYDAKVKHLIRVCGDTDIYASAQKELITPLDTIKSVETTIAEEYTKRPVRNAVAVKDAEIAKLEAAIALINTITDNYKEAQEYINEQDATYASFSKTPETVAAFKSYENLYNEIGADIEALKAAVADSWIVEEGKEKVEPNALTSASQVDEKLDKLAELVDAINDIIDDKAAKDAVIAGIQEALDNTKANLETYNTEGLTFTYNGDQHEPKTITIPAYNWEEQVGDKYNALDNKLNSKEQGNPGLAVGLEMAYAADQALESYLDEEEETITDCMDVADYVINAANSQTIAYVIPTTDEKADLLTEVNGFDADSKAAYNKYCQVKATIKIAEEQWAKTMPSVATNKAYITPDKYETEINEDDDTVSIVLREETAPAVRAAINALEEKLIDALDQSGWLSVETYSKDPETGEYVRDPEGEQIPLWEERGNVACNDMHVFKMKSIEIDGNLQKSIKDLQDQIEVEQVYWNELETRAARTSIIDQCVETIKNITLTDDPDYPQPGRAWTNKETGVEQPELLKEYNRIQKALAEGRADIEDKQKVASNTQDVETNRKDITLLNSMLGNLSTLKADVKKYREWHQHAIDSVMYDSLKFVSLNADLQGIAAKIAGLTNKIAKPVVALYQTDINTLGVVALAKDKKSYELQSGYVKELAEKIAASYDAQTTVADADTLTAENYKTYKYKDAEGKEQTITLKGYDAMIKAFGFELVALQSKINASQKNYEAHEALLKQAGEATDDGVKVKSVYGTHNVVESQIEKTLKADVFVEGSYDPQEKTSTVFADSLEVLRTDLVAVIEDSIGTFDLDCACDPKKDNLSKQLSDIEAAMNQLVTDYTTNETKHDAQLGVIETIQKQWAEVKAELDKGEDYGHPELLAAALKDMAKYQIEIEDALYGLVNPKYLEGKSNDVTIDNTLTALGEKIGVVISKLNGTYNEAVAKDNQARYDRFTEALADVQAEFDKAIKKVDQFRNIKEAQSIVDAAEAVHNTLYNMSQEVIQFKGKVDAEWIKHFNKTDIAETAYFDLDEEYKAEALGYIDDIKEVLDKFYTQIDAAANEIIATADAQAETYLYNEKAKTNQLVDAETQAEIFAPAEKTLADARAAVAEANESATDDNHAAELLADYLKVFNTDNGTFYNQVDNCVNDAAKVYVDGIIAENKDAVKAAQDEIAKLKNLTPAQKATLKSEIDDVINVIKTTETAEGKYYADVELYDNIGDLLLNFTEYEAILDEEGEPTGEYISCIKKLEQIVEEAKGYENSENSNAYWDLRSVAYDLANKAIEVYTTVQSEYPLALDYYGDKILGIYYKADQYLYSYYDENRELHSPILNEYYYNNACVEYKSMIEKTLNNYSKTLDRTLEQIAESYEAIIINDAFEKLVAEKDAKFNELEEYYNKAIVQDGFEDKNGYYEKIEELRGEVVMFTVETIGNQENYDALTEVVEKIAVLHQEIIEYVNPGTAAAAAAELNAAWDEVNDAYEALDYREEVLADESCAKALADAKKAIDDAKAAINKAVEEGKVLYKKEKLAEMIDAAADALDKAAGVDGICTKLQQKYDKNDEVYNNNLAVLAEINEAYNKLCSDIATYNPATQEIFREEIDNYGSEIEWATQYNEWDHEDIDYNDPYDSEDILAAMSTTASNAYTDHMTRENEGAYASLLEDVDRKTDFATFDTERTGLLYQLYAISGRYGMFVGKHHFGENFDQQEYEEEWNLIRKSIGYASDKVTMDEEGNFGGTPTLYGIINYLHENEYGCYTQKEYALDMIADAQEQIDALSETLEAAIADWKAIYNFMKGDVNRDGDVDILDYGKVASWILNGIDEEKYEDKKGDFYLANMDGSDYLTTSDLQLIVNKIKHIYKGDIDYSGEILEARARAAHNDAVTVQTLNGQLAIGVQNSIAYTGFQMDITLPAGASINDIAASARLNGQDIAYNQLSGNTYRVLVFGMGAGEISGNNGALINVAANNLHGTVAVSNIHFTDAAGKDYALTLAEDATAIQGVEAEQSISEKIYSVGGQLMDSMKKGVNIIKNAAGVQKIFVK